MHISILLQELCSENNLQDPDYITISDVGPPHAKIFTLQCKVATFKETGIARTKKQAKQDAAKKMLDKLTDLVPTLELTIDTSMEQKQKQLKEDASIQMAKSRYTALSRLSITKKVNLGIKLSEYHNQLKNCFTSETSPDLVERLQTIIPQDCTDISEERVKDLSNEFTDILASIGLYMSLQHLQCKSSSIYLVAVTVNSTPDIVEVSRGETRIHAEFYAILKLINTILLFLQ